MAEAELGARKQNIMYNQNVTAMKPTNLIQFRPASHGSTPDLIRPEKASRTASILHKAEPVLSPAAQQAHDARNALCSLHMLAGLLGEPGVLAPSSRRYAEDLQNVTDTLTCLVETLTTQTTSTSGSAAHAGAPTPSASTGEALQSCLPLLQAAAGPSTAVYVSSESRLPPLVLAESALERVLVNLVANAGEAMGAAGGTVRITARRALSRDQPAVLIHVSDNGPGIPAHALGQIFKPGFSSKPHGSCAPGLGLSVVEKLVQSAGGSVRVGSTRRRGTTFELRIPFIQY